MLLSFIMFIIGGFGIAFGAQKSMGIVGGYILYAICRFIVAVATRGINVTGFVLGLKKIDYQFLRFNYSYFLFSIGVELVGSDKRTFAGFVFQYFFPIGQLVLAVLAFFIRDWRILANVVAAIAVPFLLYFL